MINVGIIGATGYTGVELIKILLNHQQVKLTYLASSSYVGQNIVDIYPHLTGVIDQQLVEFTPTASDWHDLDVMFIALPHGLSMEYVPTILEKGVKVVDLGADFRLKDLAVYEATYQKHSAPQLNALAVYGMPELGNREQIAAANLIANPGCYVTATTLAIYPLVKKYKVSSVVVDAKSGVSGAGRKLTQLTHYPDCNENFSGYNFGVHRHQPEIEQNLGLPVLFCPHLLPVNRGILATVYLDLQGEFTVDDLKATLVDYYANEPFVQVVDHLPAIKEVVGSNKCHIGIRYLPEHNKVVVVSVIDNLIKGASGQAVQNMNLMFGFNESMGLNLVPINP